MTRHPIQKLSGPNDPTDMQRTAMLMQQHMARQQMGRTQQQTPQYQQQVAQQEQMAALQSQLSAQSLAGQPSIQSPSSPTQQRMQPIYFNPQSQPSTLPAAQSSWSPSGVFGDFFQNSSAKRTDLHVQLVESIIHTHKGWSVYPVNGFELHGYAGTGHISVEPLSDPHKGGATSYYQYISPIKRSDSSGGIGERTTFEKVKVTYKECEWTVYHVVWVEGYTLYDMSYFVYDQKDRDEPLIEELILGCGNWVERLGNRIWVFDMGYWQQDANLWRSVQKANWADIILPQELKDGVVHDFVDFFNGKETYAGMGVPWKRGLILYGPPGNGKTITLKALMKQLGGRDDPIPTLYVKSFFSYGGDQYAIREIFQKARQQSPCMLILEDLDSLITGGNRSFFLNELDGLEDNDGLLVVGTTNHADRLDPGISKRPSRFDRKYLFDDPSKPERVQYVKYWKHKLEDTSIDFTDALVEELASLLDGFSFAYMKEAFVSTLLYIAARRDDKKDDDEWAKEFEPTIKKQIKELKKQIDDGKDDEGQESQSQMSSASSKAGLGPKIPGLSGSIRPRKRGENVV